MKSVLNKFREKVVSWSKTDKKRFYDAFESGRSVVVELLDESSKKYHRERNWDIVRMIAMGIGIIHSILTSFLDLNAGIDSFEERCYQGVYIFSLLLCVITGFVFYYTQQRWKWIYDNCRNTSQLDCSEGKLFVWKTKELS